MKTTPLLFPILFLFCVPRPAAQANFKAGWQAADPIPKDSILSFEEKIKAHQGYLEKAAGEGDPLKQLYGQLYLVYDYLDEQDYTAATAYLLKSEGMAQQSGKPGWQGWVLHRKAIVSARLSKFEEARQAYEKAASLCGEAKDSLCVAESIEQVSIMCGKLDDFENARRYHAIAMPLIEKYGGEAQLGAALNNFGIINSRQERALESIPYFERSIAIYHKLGKHKEAAKGLNNLADAFRRLKRYDEALEIYQQCIKLNKEHQLAENLVTNYSGMQTLASEKGEHETAYEYLGLYFLLKDSLAGAETQQKIAELEIKYKTQQQELELEKSRSALEAARRKVGERTAVILFGLLLAVFGLWRWRAQTRRARQASARSRQDLAELTQLLLEKNTSLLALEEQVPQREAVAKSAPLPEDFEVGLFNQSILTAADWAAFKSAFEKAHPGYLLRLRSAFQGITDAEERLFLFIKLNLGTKESANILGISVNSVKRNRNRLRHRLGLAEEVDLEGFIRVF